MFHFAVRISFSCNLTALCSPPPFRISMQININANSLKKLVRLLRQLGDELEGLYLEQKKEPSKLRVVSQHDASIDLIIDYYKAIHPSRGRSISPGHVDWKLIKKRLDQGYSAEELKTAILENSKRQWWVDHNRHGIQDIMGKDGNLDSFIQKQARGKNATSGYSFGSEEFGQGTKGFGD